MVRFNHLHGGHGRIAHPTFLMNQYRRLMRKHERPIDDKQGYSTGLLIKSDSIVIAQLLAGKQLAFYIFECLYFYGIATWVGKKHGGLFTHQALETVIGLDNKFNLFSA